MMTRRKFAKLAFASLPIASAWGKIDSTIHGVQIGVSGYSFQHSSLDEAIRMMQAIGLGATEVWFRHIEPKTTREELRAWQKRRSPLLRKFFYYSALALIPVVILIVMVVLARRH